MRSLTFNRFLLAMFLCIGTACSLNAKIELSKLFTDNMVLQQQSDVPIWGKATPYKTVTISTSWDKKVYKVQSSSSGEWKISLKTIQAGGPYEIIISDGTKTILSNVMLGEVWVCSGQSNMEMAVSNGGGVANHKHEVATANYPKIRIFNVGKNMSNIPLDEITDNKGGWKVCSPETIGDFSAVAYFFGRNLLQNLDVPIGLINSSWGGTPAQAWASLDALEKFPSYSKEAAIIRENSEVKQIAFFEERTKEWNSRVQSYDFDIENNKAIISNPDYDDTAWSKMKLPTLWEDKYLPDFDGVVWFRKVITIPKEWEGHELLLSLGQIDDNDVTYFNGEKVGETNGFNIDRKYIISADLVKKGKALISVRINDTGGGGGFNGSSDEMHISINNTLAGSINLTDEWKYKAVLNWGNFPIAPRHPEGNPNRPGILFNAMIKPLTPFPIKGFIWYQGESNADRMYQAIEYQDLFTTMIQSWRSCWNSQLPFYYVQLANFMSRKDKPEDTVWPYTREAQFETLNLQNTGMAVTIDIGEAHDIHPKNKQDVGLRLALLARANTYGQKIASSGPLYREYRIEENKICISFDHVETGLTTKNGDQLKGFTIAGADRIFYSADAVIDGDRVIISSPHVPVPLAGRYAWANNPECNLYNKEGLPASPFRTDNWIKNE